MAGMLALCLHAVRTWGLVMRVDMVAVALSLMGVLLAARANGRVPGTTLGLLLCVAALFTKQTQWPALLAVLFVVGLRRPRKAFIAAVLALGLGAVALGALELVTGGGFLQNVIGFELGRLSVTAAIDALSPERSSAPFMALMVVAAFVLALGLWKQRAPGPRLRAMRQLVLIIRLLDPTMAARALLLLYFGLSTLMLVVLFQPGSGFNNLLDWLCVGTVLLGVMMCDLLHNLGRFLVVAAVVLVGVMLLPFRQMPDRVSMSDLERQTRLVERIAAVDAPVASEELVLLMRAGKPVVFDPPLVTARAASGTWNEAPLVSMVRSGAFAFMVTLDNTQGGSARRSPAMDAAMREAYPTLERVGARLWFHLPR